MDAYYECYMSLRSSSIDLHNMLLKCKSAIACEQAISPTWSCMLISARSLSMASSSRLIGKPRKESDQIGGDPFKVLRDHGVGTLSQVCPLESESSQMVTVGRWHHTNGSCKHFKRASSQARFQALTSLPLSFPPLSLFPAEQNRFQLSTSTKPFCIAIVHRSRNLIGYLLGTSDLS